MGDGLISTAVEAYLESLAPERPDELKKMEQQAAAEGFPIIGPVCGHLCYQLARLMGARRIFELGSGFGYSTAWFARAVEENGGGVVHHVVWDAALSLAAQEHLAALGRQANVRYHVGEAVELLARTRGPFDLVFNDIDKHGYPASLPVIKSKLRPGGLLIIDNMLWHGRIFKDSDRSADTRGVREFTRLVYADPDWIVSLVPMRDGMIIAYKQ
ncbi:MAG: O-methyltransferase [Desulfobacterales bacterium]|nr:O-methyltransferase [Desulfobacterales bacterium]